MKCTICTDRHLQSPGAATDESVLESLPDAVVTVPTIQTFNNGPNQIVAAVDLQVCLPCRKEQLRPVSRSGLLTA